MKVYTIINKWHSDRANITGSENGENTIFTFSHPWGKARVCTPIKFDGGVSAANWDDLKTMKTVDDPKGVTCTCETICISGDIDLVIPATKPEITEMAMTGKAKPISISLDALKYVLLATATSDKEPAFNSVGFDNQGNMIATDGYRIHWMNNMPKHNDIFIIPADPLRKITSDFFIAPQKGKSIIEFSEGDCLITLEINNNVGYPNYENVFSGLPKNEKVVVIKADSRILKTVSFDTLIISGDTKTKIMTMTAKNSDTNYITFSFETDISDNFVIGVKPKYIIEAMNGNDVIASFVENNAIRIADNALVMPMMIN